MEQKMKMNLGAITLLRPGERTTLVNRSSTAEGSVQA
jgi:hypothetical protein